MTGRDFFDPLVDEVLSEVAESFFEARRLLDCKIDLFHAHVKRLAEKQRAIARCAAFLNHLLMDERTAESFYRLLEIEPALFIVAKKFDPDAVPVAKPTGLGVRRKFTRMVLEAYQRLQIACDHYLFGKDRPADPNGGGPGDVYYGLIVGMLKILNQEIEKINCCLSPSCALQFAKKMRPETLQKERITGTGSHSYASVDKELLYAPIELNALDVPKYPQLPKVDKVAHKIEDFCKSLYAENADAVKHLVRELQQRRAEKKA